LNQLHLSEEDFRNAIIFGEPPHGGNHAKRIRFLKVRNSRPDNGLEVAGRTREPWAASINLRDKLYCLFHPPESNIGGEIVFLPIHS